MNYYFNCNLHGDYIGTSSKQKCPKCLEIKKNFIEKHSIENINFIKKLEIKEEKSKENISYFKIKIPNTNLYEYYWLCSNCRKFFIKNFKNLNKMFNSFELNNKIFCSHFCSNNWNINKNTQEGICKTCGQFVKFRDSIGNCCDCSKKISFKRIQKQTKAGICISCGIYNQKRDINGFGINCSCYLQHLPNQNFIKKSNNLYYYDQYIKDYILWNEFKIKFENNIEKITGSFVDEVNNDYYQSKIIPTFRTQNSEDWKGARQAFEQNLVDEDITWFVYIKFDELNRPLVVGKSGSLLVNTNGSDVSFSTDINDGPARRFLNENNITWNKTQILIIPAKNELDAFKIEKEIQIKYNLFKS